MNSELLEIISNGRPNVVVDISWVFYRSFYVFSPDKFRTSQGIPNGHFFGLVQSLRTFTRLGYNVFLCEEGKCNFRKELNENYKATRQPSEKGTEFWKEYPKVHDLISDLDNVYCVQNQNYESDDIMYSIAKLCSLNNIKCLIHTADKDLYQALDNNISILKKITLKSSEIVTYDSDEYSSKFPVKPFQLPLYRAFKGDTSDNLEPVIKRFPKDLLLDIVDYLTSHANLAGYEIKKDSHKKWIKQLVSEECWNKFLNNYKVMKLNIVDFDFIPRSPKNSYIKICDDFELTQFKSFIESLHNK